MREIDLCSAKTRSVAAKTVSPVPPGKARYCFGIPAPARDPRPAATIMAAVLAFLMARNLA